MTKIPIQPDPHPSWTPKPIPTSWDDLLDGVSNPEDWKKKRAEIEDRFHKLIRNEAAPPVPVDPDLRIEETWAEDGYRVEVVSYAVEADERAHAYIAIPNTVAPAGGHPAVVCLHGTNNWGARQTLGLLPKPGDPQGAEKGIEGKDCARRLVRQGYVTISPEHFCSATRAPEEGPYETAAFYRKHPNWSAVGKYIHDSRIALTMLGNRADVDASRIGVTGHSLGGQGSIWLAAIDDRVRCSVPSCPASTFRENPEPLHWSRDHWYIYFPQLREEFLAGRQVACDFHEMMALIAPCPLLERIAINDGDPASQAHRLTLHLKLAELYRLLGRDSAHALLVHGDGHAVPTLSSQAMVDWMDRWLKRDGAPLE